MGERNREQLWRVRDHREREGPSSSVRPICGAQGEGQAARTTRGDREWMERARGGQPGMEAPGEWQCGGGG